MIRTSMETALTEIMGKIGRRILAGKTWNVMIRKRDLMRKNLRLVRENLKRTVWRT